MTGLSLFEKTPSRNIQRLTKTIGLGNDYVSLEV